MLSAHSGTFMTDVNTVRSVPAPQWTQTWHPVSHAQVLDSLHSAISKTTGMEVKKETYSLSGNGKDMFGAWELDRNTKDGTAAWQIGVRNSLQKHFGVGICAGTRVFVCDNMAFAGDAKQVRRHTSGLDLNELDSLCEIVIPEITTALEKFEDWQAELRTHPISAGGIVRKMLTHDAMVHGVFPPSQFYAFLKCLETELDLNGENFYAFHGACTRLMRGSNLFQVEKRNRALNNLLRSYLEEEAC